MQFWKLAGDFPILHGINIQIKRNSLTLVIGPNGAGKSTLIKAIAGVVQAFPERYKLEANHIRPDQLGEFGISYRRKTSSVKRQKEYELILGLAAQKHNSKN